MPSLALPSPDIKALRSFGTLFTLILAALATWQLFQDQAMLGIALGAAAVSLITITRIWPQWLAVPATAWYGLGTALHVVVSPIVLGVLFFVVLTPVALVQRIFRRDALRLKREANRQTYWLPRESATPDAESLRRQF